MGGSSECANEADAMPVSVMVGVAKVLVVLKTEVCGIVKRLSVSVSEDEEENEDVVVVDVAGGV